MNSENLSRSTDLETVVIAVLGTLLIVLLLVALTAVTVALGV